MLWDGGGGGSLLIHLTGPSTYPPLMPQDLSVICFHPSDRCLRSEAFCVPPVCSRTIGGLCLFGKRDESAFITDQIYFILCLESVLVCVWGVSSAWAPFPDEQCTLPSLCRSNCGVCVSHFTPWRWCVSHLRSPRYHFVSSLHQRYSPVEDKSWIISLFSRVHPVGDQVSLLLSHTSWAVRVAVRTYDERRKRGPYKNLPKNNTLICFTYPRLCLIPTSSIIHNGTAPSTHHRDTACREEPLGAHHC